MGADWVKKEHSLQYISPTRARSSFFDLSLHGWHNVADIFTLGPLHAAFFATHWLIFFVYPLKCSVARFFYQALGAKAYCAAVCVQGKKCWEGHVHFDKFIMKIIHQISSLEPCFGKYPGAPCQLQKVKLSVGIYHHLLSPLSFHF